jgi:tetratricopeptide (TPR) repeat protein
VIRVLIAVSSMLAAATGCGNRAPIQPAPLGDVRSLNAAGIREFHGGDLEAAERHFAAALEEASSLDDLRGKGTALHNLASVHREMGRIDEALEESALASDALEQAEDRDGAARARALRGHLLLLGGDAEAAEAEARKAIAMCGPAARAELLATLATVLLGKGDGPGAKEALARALALEPEDAIRADLLFSLGRAELIEGRRAAAKRRLEEALELDRVTGRRRQLAATLALLGRIACEEGSAEEALAYLERAAGVYEALGLAGAAAAARAGCEEAPGGAAAP